MLDPFSYWTRVLSSWRVMGETAERVNQTVDASRTVVAARTETIGQAMRSPWSADYAELTLMVSEKVAAFSLSGSAMACAWWAMQAEHIAQAQRARAMMMRGRPPTFKELAEQSSHSSTYALRTLEAGARLGRDAVAPVHKAATANARRLRKKPGRANVS